MLVACPSCQAENVRYVGPISSAYVFAGHDLERLMPGGSLYACHECRLSFRFPIPPKEDLDVLYRTGTIAQWQYQAPRRHDWMEAKRWMQRELGTGRVLDVGCFDGAFLSFLGDDWQRNGIEINEAAVQRACERGVNIVGSDANDLQHMPDAFDVITAFDVLEHVEDPRRLLAHMRDRTRSGGLVIIASGNTEAWSWQMMGSRYWYCTIPEHLAFISASWCKRAAGELGLELLSVSTYSHEQRRTWRLRVHEALSNSLYRFAPKVFASLRRAGVGDKDTTSFGELATYPPTWTTARDHLVAIFRTK